MDNQIPWLNSDPYDFSSEISEELFTDSNSLDYPEETDTVFWDNMIFPI